MQVVHLPYIHSPVLSPISDKLISIRIQSAKMFQLMPSRTIVSQDHDQNMLTSYWDNLRGDSCYPGLQCWAPEFPALSIRSTLLSFVLEDLVPKQQIQMNLASFEGVWNAGLCGTTEKLNSSPKHEKGCALHCIAIHTGLQVAAHWERLHSDERVHAHWWTEFRVNIRMRLKSNTAN